jgi:predicted enzyme related to lactoylglutathione lyase
MTSRLRHITVDSARPYALAQFWGQVIGWQEDPDDPNLPDQDEALLLAPDFPVGLLFVSVPEGKSGKNRLHLDLQPQDRTRDEEVTRVLALGASMRDDCRRPDGRGWAVLADPEGNEFCVERGTAEREV